MELPIAPQTYQPSPQALVRAIQRSNLILARMTAEETALDGATALTNPERPGVSFANCAMEVDVPQGQTAARVLENIDAHFTERGLRGLMLSAANEWPADMLPLLETRGYRPRKMNVFLVTDYVSSRELNNNLQIIPGRAAYAELRKLFEESAADTADAMLDRLDEPRAEVFLGRLHSQPAGVVVVVTLGQIGVIDFVYTATSARGQGVATTLLAHALDHCQRAQFEQVILEAPEGCPAVPVYQRLGFKPVASFTQYERRFR